MSFVRTTAVQITNFSALSTITQPFTYAGGTTPIPVSGISGGSGSSTVQVMNSAVAVTNYGTIPINATINNGSTVAVSNLSSNVQIANSSLAVTINGGSTVALSNQNTNIQIANSSLAVTINGGSTVAVSNLSSNVQITNTAVSVINNGTNPLIFTASGGVMPVSINGGSTVAVSNQSTNVGIVGITYGTGATSSTTPRILLAQANAIGTGTLIAQPYTGGISLSGTGASSDNNLTQVDLGADFKYEKIILYVKLVNSSTSPGASTSVTLKSRFCNVSGAIAAELTNVVSNAATLTLENTGSITRYYGPFELPPSLRYLNFSWDKTAFSSGATVTPYLDVYGIWSLNLH